MHGPIYVWLPSKWFPSGHPVLLLPCPPPFPALISAPTPTGTHVPWGPVTPPMRRDSVRTSQHSAEVSKFTEAVYVGSGIPSNARLTPQMILLQRK